MRSLSKSEQSERTTHELITTCYFCSMWKRFIFAILCAWMASTSWAAPAVELAPGLSEAPLSGHLEILEDPSGSLSLSEVQVANTWQPVAGMLNIGFTKSTVWVKLAVRRPSSTAASWILSVDNVQIDEVNVYAPDGLGGWITQKAGRTLAFSDWPMNARTPSFRLDVPPGEQVVYFSLRGYHSLSSAVTLMTPEAFRISGNREALVYGSYFGVYAVVVALQLFFWLMGHQEKGSRWYFIYTLTLMAGTVINSGYPQNYFNLTTILSSTLLGVYLCMAPSVIAKLTAVWLDLDRHAPLVSMLYQRTIYICSVITSAMVLANEYETGVKLSQALTLVWVQLSFGLGLLLWIRGTAQAGFYVVIFGFIDLGIMTRFMRNLGFLPVGFVTDYALYIGITLHLIAMCLFFIYRFRNLEASLEVEQRAREEQRDFVGMVSHEFRTPLAIINTSIQQLSANLDAPIAKTQQRAQNIRNAVQRMNLLLDDYLSMDRLDSTHQPARPRPCDIYEIIEEAASDWPLNRVKLDVQDLPEKFVCDPDLLRIALRNLLANADRHSSEETSIDVKVWMADDLLHITVQDHGEGIPPEELQRLFQKYFRGKSSQGKPGAGLGLYLVQRIIHIHGGKVAVQSLPGVGTTFSIEIPTPGKA